MTDAPEEETEKVSLKATEDIQLNKASTEAVLDSGTEVVGTARRLGADDMLIVRGVFANRAQEKGSIRKLEKALQKHNPKWRGVLLHLPEGMELMQLPAAMVESLYEALMLRWDPDLYEVRMSRKKATHQASQAEEEASNLATAEEVARHLAKVQMDVINEGKKE